MIRSLAKSMGARTVLLVVGGGMLLAVFGYFQLPKTYVVEKTQTGFVPQRILIRKGDTVDFKNMTAEDMWPASDSHPTHDIYPEFDPKLTIPPYDEWKFTFDKPGVWEYHDHLNALFHATVLVTGKTGESVAACLATTKSTVKAQCWEADLADVLQRKGLPAALDSFATYYASSSEFQSQCHDIMHILGKAAAESYSKTHTQVARQETSYCGYGFYHGFTEKLIQEEGTNFFPTAVAYCEALQNNTSFISTNSAYAAFSACYHGLGHASFDSLPGTLWGDDRAMVKKVIGLCESLSTDPDKRVWCVSGVFNSLANAYVARDYKLHFDDAHPVGICNEQKEQYRVSCFREVGTSYMREKKMSFPQAISFARSFGTPAIAGASLWALFDDEYRHHRDGRSALDFADLALSLKDEPLISGAVRGILIGMGSGSEPGKEYVDMISFCTHIPRDPVRNECFAFALGTWQKLYANKKNREICAQLPVEELHRCQRFKE